MIIGDLLDARVLGPDGEAIGYVADVRLSAELREAAAAGPGDDESGDQPLTARVGRHDAVGQVELVGLLVSPSGGTSFLGFERTDVRSPWLIAALVRRLHRGTFLVAWQDVAALGDGTVTLSDGFERLDPSLRQ